MQIRNNFKRETQFLLPIYFIRTGSESNGPAMGSQHSAQTWRAWITSALPVGRVIPADFGSFQVRGKSDERDAHRTFDGFQLFGFHLAG